MVRTNIEQAADISPTRRQLARRVRVLRAVHGWSQETLAELAGIHRTYISNIERGRCNVGIETLDKLARAFNTTAARLLSARMAQ